MRTGSHVQLRPLVSDVLDLCGSTAEKHVCQVRQGACHRDLLANFQDVRVARVAARPAMTEQVSVVVHNQACVGVCLAFVFPDRQLNGPAIYCAHHRTPPSSPALTAPDAWGQASTSTA